MCHLSLSLSLSLALSLSLGVYTHLCVCVQKFQQPHWQLFYQLVAQPNSKESIVSILGKQVYTCTCMCIMYKYMYMYMRYLFLHAYVVHCVHNTCTCALYNTCMFRVHA